MWFIGDPERERESWIRPEDINYERDGIVIDDGAQVFATMSAAFASCSRALSGIDEAYEDYSTELLTRAISLYEFANAKMRDETVAQAERGNINIAQEDPQNPINTTSVAFQSSSKFDDMLWAASWLHLVADNYEEDVFRWFGEAEEGQEPRKRFTFDWDNLYIGANMVLLQRADGRDDALEETVRTFLKQWVCGEPEQIDYTTRGRAQNEDEPALGQTVNVAFFSTMYAKMLRGRDGQAFVGYRCWPLSQARYILGDNARLGSPFSFMVGYGSRFPTQVYDRAASCPSQLAGGCGNAEKASSQPNPNILNGALVFGPPDKSTDTITDVRDEDNEDTLVRLDWNAGLPGLYAGLLDLGGSWAQCLQGYGAQGLSYHPVCNPI